MERITITVADEHTIVRNLVVARLGLESDFQAVGLAVNTMEVYDCVLRTRPQILLLDPPLRDGRGLELIRRVRAALPETVIVVLTAFTETAFKIELANLGVRWILDKGIESHKLVTALRAAAQGNGSQIRSSEELPCLTPV